MTDIWSFLTLTLTATVAALFIYAVKHIFRYKLSPVWQFSVWSVLLFVLSVPAAFTGGFLIIDWSAITEFLKTNLEGEYNLSQTYSFFPILTSFSTESITDILFLTYSVGVLFFACRYIFIYIKLRRVLRTTKRLSEDEFLKISAVAEKYSLPVCDCVKCDAVAAPFVCGLFSPVLVFPEGETDEKVILHELLHLKHKDALWGIIIAIFRSIHWCNPVLWFIFNKINNDLEELCDFRVLELLEGEERRTYGNILLSMVNEKYACLPGTSSAANGGKNIASRIKAITNYKQYPVSSAILNICIIAVLTIFLLGGDFTLTIYASSENNYSESQSDFLMAQARTVRCYTPAGAIDTYGKAVLQNNGYYRATCAPIEEHKAIAEEIKNNISNDTLPLWDGGLKDTPVSGKTYHLYNLEQHGRDFYTAVIAFDMGYTEDAPDKHKLMYQQIDIVKENGRWVIKPEDGFDTVYTYNFSVTYSCFELPCYRFTGENDSFYAERYFQNIITIKGIDNNSSRLPDLYAKFDSLMTCHDSKIIYKGDSEQDIEKVSCGFEDFRNGKKISSSSGMCGKNSFDENNIYRCCGGGGGGGFTADGLRLPDSSELTIRINNGDYEKIMLYPEEK